MSTNTEFVVEVSPNGFVVKKIDSYGYRCDVPGCYCVPTLDEALRMAAMNLCDKRLVIQLFVAQGY